MHSFKYFNIVQPKSLNVLQKSVYINISQSVHSPWFTGPFRLENLRSDFRFQFLVFCVCWDYIHINLAFKNTAENLKEDLKKEESCLLNQFQPKKFSRPTIGVPSHCLLLVRIFFAYINFNSEILILKIFCPDFLLEDCTDLTRQLSCTIMIGISRGLLS